MQIIGSVQIVTDVTSVVPTLLSCIALLILYFCCSFACFVLFVRMCLGCFAPAGATGTLSLDPASL